jgi:ubiquitin-conjugating enzyme E2 Q
MPNQYLTLMISGFHGSYPALSSTGQVVSGFAKLRFYVGLSDGKPSKEVVESLTRSYGLKEEEVYVPEPEPEIPEYDPDDPDTWEIPEKEPTPEPELTLEPGRFDKFSLSTSLNSLLNDSLLSLIQLRLKFGIGWAGAEVLLAEQTARQVPAESIFESLAHQIHMADEEEKGIALLPVDPFLRHSQAGGNDLNLPLVAYSYLLRRFLVSFLFLALFTWYSVGVSFAQDSVWSAINGYIPTLLQ